MRGRVLLPLDKCANRVSKRGKLRKKQLTTMWEIRFSSSVYFSYDLWAANLSALLNGVVIWVEAVALSSDVKIRALSTSKTSLRIKQTTRCHILDDTSAHAERCYINNTHLLGCCAVWRVTEYTLTFWRSQSPSTYKLFMITELPLPEPNIPDDQNHHHHCVQTSNLVLHGLRTPYEGTSYLYVNTNITAYLSLFTGCLYTRT